MKQVNIDSTTSPERWFEQFKNNRKAILVLEIIVQNFISFRKPLIIPPHQKHV